MNYLQIGLIVLSILSAVLSLSILRLQTCFIRQLQNKYNKLNDEMRYIFGWDTPMWKSEFQEMKNNTRNAHDKVKELMQLPLIKAAMDEQKMQELLKQEKYVKDEIERLKSSTKH